MARITHVAKARKDAGKCYKCGTPIKAGEPYKWFANRIGRSSQRKNYCVKCAVRPSDTTTSDKLSQLYAAQESIEDSMQRGDLDWESYRDQVKSAVEEAANTAREVGDEYRSSKDNLPENFQNGQPGEGLDEKADQCDSWADVLESAAQEIESTEQEESETCTCGALIGDHPTEDCLEFDPEENESCFDDIEGIASDAAGALEL